MRISRVISGILLMIGALLLVVALLAGLASLPALVERLRYGSGIMFGDAEFLGLLALSSSVLGLLLIFLARRIRH